MASKREVDAIIERGFPNLFVEIAEGIYGLEWGEDGVCPYLQDAQCAIYSIRPLGCRMFPVVQTLRGDIILIECPVATKISSEELEARKRILLQRPRCIIEESGDMRNGHLTDVMMRVSKYHHRRL